MYIYQQMSTDLVPEISCKFYCKCCDYTTSRKSQYERHLLTDKHKKYNNSTNINNKVQKSSVIFECKCGKIYNDRSGLWRHKQICNTKFDTKNDKTLDYNMIYELFKIQVNENKELKDILIEQNKQNQELQKHMIELCKNGTNNNNTTNSHNKAFNLNFFLNETCKDAMNIMDFVDSIQLQLSDLEKVGELGYVNGISNIIVKNLKELDIEKRPVHCTDKKRETMYVKDENKWEKDEENNKIRKAIKRVVSKNQRLIPKFKEAHPDCNTYHSKFSDQYNKLILESCGGSGDNDLEKEEKIIQNISKNVLVDK